MIWCHRNEVRLGEAKKEAPILASHAAEYAFEFLYKALLALAPTGFSKSPSHPSLPFP
jgi:hypothetical protein